MSGLSSTAGSALGSVFGSPHGVATDINDRWFWWPYVERNTDLIWDKFTEHATLVLLAVGIGILIALPLSLLAVRFRWLYPTSIAIGAVLYTIPSIALIAFLIPITGLSTTTVVIPLASYTILILVRNFVTGLDGVSPEVKEAARGMGYSPWRQTLRVELPLALPAFFAGIRITTVTIIGLVPIAAIIGRGGFGSLMNAGFQRGFRTPITVGIVLTVAFAVTADLLILLTQRLVTPWTRRGTT